MTVKDNIINFLKSKNYPDENIEKIFKKAPDFNKNIIEYLIDIEKIEEDEILKFFSKEYNIPIKEPLVPIEKKESYYVVFKDGDIGIFFPANKKILLSKNIPEEKIKLIPYSLIKESKNEDIQGIRGIIIDLIKQTKEKKATDIHFESKEYGAVIKIRLLGELVEIAKYEKDIAFKILRVIKHMAADYTPGFDPEEYNEVQDARIELPNLNLGIRISFAPSIYDYDSSKRMQNFVIRLLNKEKRKVKGVEELYKLGYEKEDAEVLIKNSKLKNGLIIMSGATGSGKSLTFNTLLALLSPKLKILSAEDPVEYALDNAVQHQILEFTKKVGGQDKIIHVGYMDYMRGFMRQDPDVIFIGEWRKNPELTESLVYASETGHLVYTTLHSSRVVNVANLLITQYGLKPEDLENNVNLIINQRLVKKICPYCSIEHTVVSEEIEDIKSLIRFKDKNKLDSLIGKTIKKVNPNGCEHCIIKDAKGEILSAGYIGRTAIYEYLEFDEEVRATISETTSTRKIEDILIKKIEEKKAKSFVDTSMKKVEDKIIDLTQLKQGLL